MPTFTPRFAVTIFDLAGEVIASELFPTFATATACAEACRDMGGLATVAKAW